MEGHKHIHVRIHVHIQPNTHTHTLALTFALTLTLKLTLTLTHTHIHVHTHLHMHIHTYTYTRTYTNTRACTCVFACARRGRGGGRGGRDERGVVVGGSVGGWVGECVLVRMCVLCVLIPSAVSPQDENGAQQLHQVKRMIGGLGKRVVLDLFSNLEICKIQWLLLVNLWVT